MALANCTRPMHHEISAETILKRPADNGVERCPDGVTDPRSLAHRVSREPAILRGGTAISQHRTYRLPWCLNTGPAGSGPPSAAYRNTAISGNTAGPVLPHRP